MQKYVYVQYFYWLSSSKFIKIWFMLYAIQSVYQLGYTDHWKKRMSYQYGVFVLAWLIWQPYQLSWMQITFYITYA